MRIVVRCIALLIVAWLLLLAWQHYVDAPTLMRYIPRHMRVNALTPLYARITPIDLEANLPHVVRAIVAMVSGLTVCWLAFRIRSLPTWLALVMAVLSVASINCSVAAIRGGWEALDAPFQRRGLEYFSDVPRVRDDPVAFARDYASIHDELTLHSATHPPGGVLLLWAGTMVVDESVTTASSLAIAVSSLAIVPAWWLAKLIGGRRASQRVVPICAAAPALVLFGATSMDGVFTAAILLALATGVWAIRRASTWSSLWRAPIAGACLWIAAFLTFAAVLVPLVLLLLTLASRPRLSRFAAILCVATGIAAASQHTVVALSIGLIAALLIARPLLTRLGSLLLIGASFIALQGAIQFTTGYDFIATAEAAMRKDQWAMGTTGHGSREEWLAISVNNLAAFVFGGTGLAMTAASLLAIPIAAIHWRSHAARFTFVTWLVLLTATLSTLFTLETERVWMSLVPLFAIAAATLVRDRLSLLLLIVLLAVQTILTEINSYTYW